MSKENSLYFTFNEGSFVTMHLGVSLKNEKMRQNLQKVIGFMIPKLVAVAKNYAPVSPTQKELDEAYMRRRGKKKLAARKKTARFKERKNRPSPGGLERSIFGKAAEDGGYLYIPATAPAAKYAHYIHDMKGVLWHKRGIGTQKKGGQADDQFITRAIYDNTTKLADIMRKAMEDALK